MKELRQFQREDVDLIKKNNLRVIVASSPGTGKTVVAIMSVLETVGTSLPVLVICPASVTHNWKKEFNAWAPGLRVEMIEDMTAKITKEAEVYIISWALLDPRELDLRQRAFQTVVADECFPAGTRVATKEGSKFIEDIAVGDMVCAEDTVTGERYYRKVLRRKETTREKLVKVTHADGFFLCTPEHKIWTVEDGYTRADQLRNHHHLRVLRSDSSKKLEQQGQAKILHQELLGSMACINCSGKGDCTSRRESCMGSTGEKSPLSPSCACPADICEDARAQPDATTGSESESIGHAKANRASTCAARGQGARSFCSTEAHSRPSGGFCTRGVYWSPEISKRSVQHECFELHHRLGTLDFSRGCGNRWGLSYISSSTVSGQEEGSSAYTSRVECVEIYSRGDKPGCGFNSSKDYSRSREVVYDIEVEEFHNYFAEGVLVSNCHLAKNPEALRSQALYRLTRKTRGLLTLTGTPIVNRKEELEVLEALYGKKPPMIRRLLEEVEPDVPPKSRSYLYVQLRERARMEYRRAVDDFEGWLRKEKERLLGEGLAEDAVERAMVAEAFAKMGYLRRLVGEAKVPAAADWIARAVRMGEPVVVFVEHQVVLKKLIKSLHRQRIRHCVLEGKTPTSKRQQYIEAFQDNRYPVMLCTKAGKEGITLHAARHLLFVERFFTCADEEQAEDRIRRMGQKFPTTIWYLHAPDTVDDRLDAIVQAKRRLISQSLRTAHTKETARLNVLNIVRNWSTFVTPKVTKLTKLGHGDPLPPLPSPSITYAVVFGTARWTPQAARRWCRMHGYHVERTLPIAERLRLEVHPIDVFKAKSFSVMPICSDIKVITGQRLSPANEKQMRRRLEQS